MLSEPGIGSIVGDYEVDSVLGAGGMATVYLVRHSVLGTPFALKVLHVTSRAIRSRLLQEARVQSALRHPNIVGVHDVLLVGDQPALLLEYVDGPNLEAAIADGRRFTVPQIDALARGIVAGVQAAHRAGYLHRDLKPANVLLQGDWPDAVPRISDFGLAKIVANGGPSATQTGQLFGTPCYMAPEQFRDAKGVDARADLFSLGCLLYEVVCGRRAFPSDDLFELHARICAGSYEPLPRDVPARMVEAIEGALVPDPDHRIADCDTFLSVWDGRVHTRDGVPCDFTDSESPTMMVDVYTLEDAPELTELVTVVQRGLEDETRVVDLRPNRSGLGWMSAWIAAITALTLPLGLVGLGGGVLLLVLIFDDTRAPPGRTAELDLPVREEVPTPPMPAPVVASQRAVAPPVVPVAPGWLTVTIETEQDVGWANVFVDDQDAGRRAPFRDLPVAPGRHRIRVENPHVGGTLLEAEFDVLGDRTTVIPVRF